MDHRLGRRSLCAAAIPLALWTGAASAQQRPAQPPPAYPAAANGEGSVTGGYAVTRSAEDWRGYRDPAKRDDPLDRLKYLPLTPSGDVYLTLNGELRFRVDHLTNPDLRAAPAQRSDLTRVMLGGDLHLGPHLRVYGELAHSGVRGGTIGLPGTSLPNDLVAPQLFAEVSGTAGGVALGVRYGRQEFTDGPQLLVSQRDNNTIHISHHGLHLWARGSRMRIGLFDFRPMALGPEGLSDDRPDRARRFSGATLGFVLPPVLPGARLYLDPFAWRLRTKAVRRGVIVADEARTYLGARLWGDVGPVTLDWTINHQHGRQSERAIDAWQVFLAQTLRLGAASDAPRIGVQFNYASGGSYRAGKLGAAIAPFGTGSHFSYQIALAPTNMVAVAPNFGFTPVKRLRLTAEHQFTWRADSDDAVYRASGAAYAGTQTVRGRHVGDFSRVQALWTPARRLTLGLRYEHLVAGEALSRAGYRSSDIVASWAAYKF